jgi:hypothetical protein
MSGEDRRVGSDVGNPNMASTAPVLTLSTTAPASGALPLTLVASIAAAVWDCSDDEMVRVTLPVVVRLRSRSRRLVATLVWDFR